MPGGSGTIIFQEDPMMVLLTQTVAVTSNFVDQSKILSTVTLPFPGFLLPSPAGDATACSSWRQVSHQEEEARSGQQLICWKKLPWPG